VSSVVLTDSSTVSPVHVLMLSIHAVRGLPRLRAPDIVLALSLSPGNFLVSSWYDHSMLPSLLQRCLIVPSLLQFYSLLRLYARCSNPVVQGNGDCQELHRR